VYFRSIPGADRSRRGAEAFSADPVGLWIDSASLLDSVSRAHYTYAEVNTFRFIRDLFGWQRNNYDKLGHFAQGFVPAIIAREICFAVQP
jgi:putative membrane protein